MAEGIGEALEALGRMAPLQLAGDWDNVGTLVEGTRPLRRVGLCIDLTASVWAELRQADVDLIVAYHPVIFAPLKRLTARDPAGRTLLEVIRAGVHVYSPHTALDAAADGMADWLVRAAGPLSAAAPISPTEADPAVGEGRIGTLAEAVPLDVVVDRIKAHLGLDKLRVAAVPDGSSERPIATIAACPGAGGSVVGRARGVDLILTGEMRHHDVLRWVSRGTAVVLAEHTNTERGFLPILADRLRQALPTVEVVCARTGRDPLAVW